MGASISQVERADNPYMKEPVFRASVNAAQTRAGSAATKHANALGIGDEARTPSMALMSPTSSAGDAPADRRLRRGYGSGARLSMIKLGASDDIQNRSAIDGVKPCTGSVSQVLG